MSLHRIQRCPLRSRALSLSPGVAPHDEGRTALRDGLRTSVPDDNSSSQRQVFTEWTQVPTIQMIKAASFRASTALFK